MEPLHSFIHRKVVTVPQHMLIEDVVKILNAKKISCVLVYDSNQRIVGIVTERDLVRKISLLDIDCKLQRKILHDHDTTRLLHSA